MSVASASQHLQKLEQAHVVSSTREGSHVFYEVASPEALSVPIEELEEQLEKLPKNRRIVAYCRGPFCTFVEKAVQRLKEAGFDAERLDLGVSDFRHLGVDIAAAS